MEHVWLSAFEKAAQSYLNPLFERLHLATRRTAVDESSGVAGAQVLDSLQYADLFWEEA
jgi:hypothetical protein